jgi:hypothetical protein
VIRLVVKCAKEINMNIFNKLCSAVLPGVVTIALTGALAGPVQAWQANNRHTVNPVSDINFEVVGRPGSSGVQFWCAAGDYARQVLGASAVQRVYLVRGPAPAMTRNWNRAVLFSLVAPQDADLRPGFALSMERVGDNMNAADAQTYCLDERLREY